MQSWHPDTCPAVPGCIIALTGKGEPESFVRLCAFHQQAIGIGEPALLSAVADKNREKNRAVTVAADTIGERIPDDPDNFVVPDWRVDETNVVHILLPGRTVGEKNRVRNAVDAAVGAGKVVVE